MKATSASAARSLTTPSALSVTSTGVCMTAPAKTPAERSPREAAIARAWASARPGVLRTSARRAPIRSSSAPSWASVPVPKITRVGKGWWTKGWVMASSSAAVPPSRRAR